MWEERSQAGKILQPEQPPVLEEEGEKPSLPLFRNGLADCPRDAQAFLTGACWETWSFGRKHLTTNKEALGRDLVELRDPSGPARAPISRTSSSLSVKEV